jgi:hypothetical protein
LNPIAARPRTIGPEQDYAEDRLTQLKLNQNEEKPMNVSKLTMAASLAVALAATAILATPRQALADDDEGTICQALDCAGGAQLCATYGVTVLGVTATKYCYQAET